jgi:hypothetical protein
MCNILLGTKEGIIQIHPLGASLCRTPKAILTDVEVFLQKIDFYART